MITAVGKVKYKKVKTQSLKSKRGLLILVVFDIYQELTDRLIFFLV